MISWEEFSERFMAFGAAIGVHLLMAALVVLGTMNWQPFRTQQPTAISIEAVIVDTSEIKRQRDEARKAVEMEERRRQRQRELEEQRQREEEDARRQRELEEQRQREAQDRLMQLRKERERKLEDERLRQQRELEQIREQREAAERQRKIEEERLKQLEAREERQRQDELRQQEEAARTAREQEDARRFRAGQLADLQTTYIATIAAVVTDNWLRPPTAQAGLECRVRVVQIPGGEVISSSLVGRCNGDEATRRSILAAVDRTGILPYRGFEDVFQREIEFIFTYSGE